MQRSACFYSISVEASVIIVFWKAYMDSRAIFGFLVKSFLVYAYIFVLYIHYCIYVCMKDRGKNNHLLLRTYLCI